MYCDKKRLMEYINILKEYKENNPEVVKRSLPPVVMSAHILNGWAGIGEEPIEKVSYSSIRRNLVKESIEQSTIDWIKENRDSKIFCINKPNEEKTELLNIKEYISEYIKTRDLQQLDNIENIGEIIDNIESYKTFREMPINLRIELNEILKCIMNSTKYSKPMIQRVRKKIKENSKKYKISSENFIFNDDWVLKKDSDGR